MLNSCYTWGYWIYVYAHHHLPRAHHHRRVGDNVGTDHACCANRPGISVPHRSWPATDIWSRSAVYLIYRYVGVECFSHSLKAWPSMILNMVRGRVQDRSRHPTQQVKSRSLRATTTTLEYSRALSLFGQIFPKIYNL